MTKVNLTINVRQDSAEACTLDIQGEINAFAENILMGAKLSEYHTGYRAYSRKLLERISFMQNSDDFTFDNQILAQILWQGYLIAEVSCPTRYFAEASSINFSRSVQYGLGCLATALSFRMARMKLARSPLFVPQDYMHESRTF